MKDMDKIKLQQSLHERSTGEAISEHIRKYLILYMLLSVSIALTVGYFTDQFTTANKGLFSNLIILFAVLTIYPSMIQLRMGSFTKELRSWKPILISTLLVFVISPVIALSLGPRLGTSIGTGFVVSNIVPASSASIGYVLIAGGSIELATALAITSLIISVPAIPIILGLYSSQTSLSIPIEPILMSIVYILVMPLIVGQATRYALIRFGRTGIIERSSKKYLSLMTMVSMLALIFTLVDKEAPVIIQMPQIVGYLVAYQSSIILGILALSIVISRFVHLSYEEHQAVAFISVTKNQSVAAAIAVLALSQEAALAPAVIPMIQPVIAVLYIHLEKYVKKLIHIKANVGNAI